MIHVTASVEVVEFEAGRKVKITSRQSRFPITVTRSVEPLAEGRMDAVVHTIG